MKKTLIKFLFNESKRMAFTEQEELHSLFQKSSARLDIPIEVAHIIFMGLVDSLFNENTPVLVRNNLQVIALSLLSKILKTCPESIPIYLRLLKQHTVRIVNLLPDGSIVLFNGKTVKSRD